MKVLLINPWAVNNDKYYASGFVKGICSYVELDFVTNYYYDGEKPNGKLFPLFFKQTENMERSLKRKILRGIEYIKTWREIIKLSKQNKYDTIHIHWLLMYKIDLFFLKKLRKNTNQLILTAHNAVPHINSEKSIGDLKKIYSLFDVLLVHGQSIKDELVSLFSEYADKVAIQYHGEYYQQSTGFESTDDSDFVRINDFTEKHSRVFIMFGRHFYNKGTDRLIKIWRDDFKNSGAGLLVLGRSDSNYPEFDEVIKTLDKNENILIMNHFINDNTLNFAIAKSSVIVTPYRHASMSGVIYTAAAFSKPVLCTDSGALSEYLVNGSDSIVCGLSDEELKKAIYDTLEYSSEQLCDMGRRLAINIHNKYSWEVIAKELVDSIYRVKE